MDNVNIDSVGGNSNLQDWASEETLQMLLRVTLDNKKLTTKQTQIATETLKLLKKVHKQPGKPTSTSAGIDTPKQTTAKKKQTQATEKNTEATEKNTKETSLASTAMGALAFAAGSLVKLFTDTYGTYNNLIKYGSLVQGGLDGMSGGLGDLGVLMKASGASLSSLEKAITSSSRAIKMYGVKTFAETIGQVSEQLYKFGFTNSESAEFIAKDLESRRRAGLINNVTSAQYQQGLMQGTKNLMKFSKILGENWEGLQQDASTAIDANDSFQLWIRTLAEGSKAYENAYQSAQNVAMAFGPELGAKIAEMAAKDSGTQGTNATYMALVESAGQEVADRLWNVSRQIRNGSLSTEKSFDSLASVAKDVRNFGIKNQQQLQILKDIGKGETLKVAASLLSLAESSEALTAEQMKSIAAENTNQEKLKRLQSQYEKMFNSFKGAWISGLDTLFNSEKTQKLINTTFSKITEFFNSESFQKMINNLFTGFTWLIEKIASGINYLFEINPETGQTNIADMADSVKKFISEKFPTMVEELTNMARSIMSFIDDIKKGGLSSALFGVSNGMPTQSADVTKVYPFTYDSDKLNDIRSEVEQDAEKRKLLKEAEKIWADPLYKDILNEKRFVPTSLSKPGDRDIAELARDNIKKLGAVGKIPNISMIPGTAFDSQYSGKSAINKSAQIVANAPRLIESYNAKTPVTESANKKQAEEIAKATAETTNANQVETTETSAKDIKAINDDKMQGLIYSLDTLTGDLQNLILVPDLLASINNVLTSIKNGQNAKLV